MTNKFAKTLLPPGSPEVDRVYQGFCNIISSASKRFISRGRRNSHIPCWDLEFENLYRVFLRSDGNKSKRAATPQITKLDRKPRDRWSKTVQSINFSHSSRKAWSILNNLTGRPRHSFCHCSVSADAIASQLIRNGRYEDGNRASSQIISQEMSDLWRAITSSPVNISRSFTSRELTVALNTESQVKLLALTLFVRSLNSMLELL